MPMKIITLVEPRDASKYNWVDSEILGVPYVLINLVIASSGKNIVAPLVCLLAE